MGKGGGVNRPRPRISTGYLKVIKLLTTKKFVTLAILIIGTFVGNFLISNVCKALISNFY